MTKAICAVALLVSAVAVRAENQPQLTSEQRQKLDKLADQVKEAVAAGDLRKAASLADDLTIAIFRIRQSAEPTGEEKLRNLEQSAEPRTPWVSIQLAWAALDVRDFGKAQSYAQEALAAASDAKNPWHGDAVYYANNVLGRVALERDNDVRRANQYLLAAGRTPGSALLNHGPNMTLAKELLEAGQGAVVLEFFGLCREFWTSDRKKLDEWTATVRGGGVPDFGVNLRYP